MSEARRRPAPVASPRERPRWARAVDAVSDACGVVAAAMILVAVLLTCQMIWVRYVANASTVWQTETVIYLVLGATLVGLPYVQRVRGHVSVDLLPNLLPAAARRALAGFVLVVGIAVVGVMLWHSAELWHVAFTRGWRTDTVWGPPQWIPYLALPLGFGLFLVQLAADLGAVVLGVDEGTSADGEIGHGAAALATRDTAGVDGEPATGPGAHGGVDEARRGADANGRDGR